MSQPLVGERLVSSVERATGYHEDATPLAVAASAAVRPESMGVETVQSMLKGGDVPGGEGTAESAARSWKVSVTRGVVESTVRRGVGVGEGMGVGVGAAPT